MFSSINELICPSRDSDVEKRKKSGSAMNILSKSRNHTVHIHVDR